MFKKLYYGAAFYPELSDRKDLIKDIRYMKRAGINLARMAEFAWSEMEPEEGKFNTELFSEVIALLYENKIETVLCTPTEAPPAWVSHGYPERLFTDKNFVKLGHGARQHLCTNNSYFRERSRKITEVMARELGSLPGVVAWQTDNEFRSHVSDCFCETCLEMWHEWLEKRYGTVEKLNEAWQTGVWSQGYPSFDQIPQPGPTPVMHNASLQTAYRLFHLDNIVDFQNEQVEIIRKFSKAPITHNACPRHHLDSEKHFENLDFAAFDDYMDSDNWQKMVMNYDFYRNVKENGIFWVMETSPGQNGFLNGYHKMHPQHFLRAEALAAYCLGAKGFCYWQWKQTRGGIEMAHGSILSAWGKPAAGFDDVKEAGVAMKRLEKIFIDTKSVKSDIAMTYSDIARQFFLSESIEGLNYISLMHDFHKLIVDTGFPRDVIPDGSNFSNHKILLTPYMPCVTKEYLKKAKDFVMRGGIWILGPLSGYRTDDHTVHKDAALGAELEKFAGVETVYSYGTTGSGNKLRAFGKKADLFSLGHFFKVKTAKSIARVCEGRSKGYSIITENSFGKGKVVLIGSMLEGEKGDEIISKLIKSYISKAQIDLPFIPEAGTLAIPRESKKNGLIWFFVNMDGKKTAVKTKKPGKYILTGAQCKKSIQVSPYDIRIVKFTT